MTIRVVALFRVSTDTQQQRGASLATQESRFDEIASSKGWNVVADSEACLRFERRGEAAAGTARRGVGA